MLPSRLVGCPEILYSAESIVDEHRGQPRLPRQVLITVASRAVWRHFHRSGEPIFPVRQQGQSGSSLVPEQRPEQQRDATPLQSRKQTDALSELNEGSGSRLAALTPPLIRHRVLGVLFSDDPGSPGR